MRFNFNLSAIKSGNIEVNCIEGCTTLSSWSQICYNHEIPLEFNKHVYFTRNGKLLQSDDQIFNGDCVCLHVRLNGGKGGFGSMLRAMGSQIEKTTNKEACRDLSGRRMRDVNNEKKMMEWAKKKLEQDTEKEAKMIEKLEKKLERPKHFFNDPEYEKSLERTQDNVEDALKKGLEAHKRKVGDKPKSKENTDIPAKKSKLWLGLDEDSESDSSDDDDDDIAMLAGMKSSSINKASSSSGNSGLKDKSKDSLLTPNDQSACQDVSSISEKPAVSQTDV